jgi:2-polyprenyl-3-methyl-5-hydroxy-6-metoxy-1,4-benzoquinol methylase
MSRSVNKYAVFISSPGDVNAERDCSRAVIREWNARNSLKLGIELEPLLWEDGEIPPDMEGLGQEEIDERLLSRADLLIAIFWGRIGAGGTMNEIGKFKGKKLAYFCNRAFPHDLDLDQIAAVRALKESLKAKGAFIQSYKETGDFESILSKHIEQWADEECKGPAKGKQAGKNFRRPQDFRVLSANWTAREQPGCVLLFNPELDTFTSESELRDTWGELIASSGVHRVVIALPPTKMRRMIRQINEFSEEFKNLEGTQKFEVTDFPDELGCPLPAVSFAAFREGEDFTSGKLDETSVLFVLSDPFSKRARTTAYDSFWKHEVMLVCDKSPGSPSLGGLIKRYFSDDRTSKLMDLMDLEGPVHPSGSELLLPGDMDQPAALSHRLRVRQDLFFSNVPTYVLDRNFNIIDWNVSFDLVFGASGFHRGEYVTAFLDKLVNSAQVIARGRNFVGEPPLFDDEEFIFMSPKFGRMVFLKTTAQAIDDDVGECHGWNVALSLTSVERGDEYRRLLRQSVEYETLMRAYAPAYNRITGNFVEYQRLAEAVADSVDTARTVLDAGTGPGHLARLLAGRGKNVVALDSNDSMLCCAYQNCATELQDHQIEIHKVNLESASAKELSNVCGEHFRPPYDAVVMLNVFYAISDKPALLRFLRSVMKPGATLSITGPNEDLDLSRLFNDVHAGDPRPDDERLFQHVNRRMFAQGLLKQSLSETSKLLLDAGFEIQRTDTTLFSGQGVLFVATMQPDPLPTAAPAGV